MPLQEISEAHRAPGMTRGRASLLHDEPRRLDRVRFHGVRIHAIISDQRVRHHEDLTAVRRIRQGFRVARHVRVENEFSEDPAPGPEKRPPGHRSVLEDEGPFHSLDPHPIFDSAYEGFPLAEISARSDSATAIVAVRVRSVARPFCPSGFPASTRGHKRDNARMPDVLSGPLPAPSPSHLPWTH